MKNDLRIALGIFLGALVLRLAYWFFLREHYLFYDQPSADVVYYQDWARRIASGDVVGKDVFFGLPLYPYFLAVLWRLSLGVMEAVRVWHVVLGSLNCVLVYFLAKKVFDSRTGILAGVLAATNFILIHYDWLMMPVPLMICLSLLVVLALLNFEALKNSEVFIVGILTGLTVLGDGKFLFFAGLSTLYLLSRPGRPPVQRIKWILPFVLGVTVMVAGVAVRNRLVGGDWVLISAQTGLSLYAGNHEGASGVYEHPDFLRPDHRGQDEDQRIIAEAQMQRALKPSEVSQFWKSKAVDFIRRQPGAFLQLVGKKFLLFFTDVELAHDIDLILQRDWVRVLDYNPYFLICPLGILGMILAWRGGRRTAYFHLLIASQLLMTLIFFLTTHHRVMILPIWLIFEAYGLMWMVQKIRQREFRRLVPVGIYLAAFLLFFRPQPLDAEDLSFLQHSKSGLVYENKNDFSTAQAHYQQALQVRPYDTNTLYNLANTYLKQDNFVQAEQYYVLAFKTSPYNVDVLFNLGYTYQMAWHDEEALKAFRTVLQYQPASPDAHYRMAEIFARRGDCAQAREHYVWIMEYEPRLTAKINALIDQCPLTDVSGK